MRDTLFSQRSQRLTPERHVAERLVYGVERGAGQLDPGGRRVRVYLLEPGGSDDRLCKLRPAQALGQC